MEYAVHGNMWAPSTVSPVILYAFSRNTFIFRSVALKRSHAHPVIHRKSMHTRISLNCLLYIAQFALVYWTCERIIKIIINRLKEGPRIAECIHSLRFVVLHIANPIEMKFDREREKKKLVRNSNRMKHGKHDIRLRWFLSVAITWNERCKVGGCLTGIFGAEKMLGLFQYYSIFSLTIVGAGDTTVWPNNLIWAFGARTKINRLRG